MGRRAGERRERRERRIERKKVGSEEKERTKSKGRWGGRLATTGLNMTTRVPEGLSMVADSTSGPAGVWAAGIQVEAAANPKESSPWLPAPASTGLHADLPAGTRIREEHERTIITRAGSRIYTCTPRSSLSRVSTFFSFPVPTPRQGSRRRVPPLTHFPLQLLRT